MISVINATNPVLNECLELDDLRRNIPSFKVGDLVTRSLYSDQVAGRIIDIRRNGKEIVMQDDEATIDPSFKPIVIEGGFAGHCVNQNDQSYTYKADPNGSISAFTLRTWRGVKVWTRKGDSPNGHNQINHGQRKFYDYNF